MPSKLEQTVAHVKILHALGAKKRRTRLPKQVYPKSIEREYAQAMIGHLDRSRSALTPLLHALPDMLDSARASRMDADESKRMRSMLATARAQIAASVNPTAVENLAETFGRRTQAFNRQQLGRQVQAALGVDVVGNSSRVKAALDHFVGENVALIKSVPAQVVDQIEGIVSRAFTNGQLNTTVADEIQERFDVGESRARLIARDQIGKLYGQTNAIRQQDLGVQSFIWRTAGDERVREEHEDLDGEEFPYDDPPDEGLPGEPIQCRCYAEPVFGDLQDAVSTDDSTDT